MKQTLRFLTGLTTLLAMSSSAQANAIKLWPQITPGIFNHANVLAMRCEVTEDGLTVTDMVWDTYKVQGCGKRWTLNMGSPMKVPLKNYKFGPEFSGLPVNLTSPPTGWATISTRAIGFLRAGNSREASMLCGRGQPRHDNRIATVSARCMISVSRMLRPAP